MLEIEGVVTSSVSMAAAAAAHRAAGMGISFDELPPSVRHRLEGLIVSIDPSAMKQPVVAKRVAKAPVLMESTELTPAHLPKFVPSKTYVPAVNRPALNAPVAARTDQVVEGLRRDLEEKELVIQELQKENAKLRQRLLNLVNHG